MQVAVGAARFRIARIRLLQETRRRLERSYSILLGVHRSCSDVLLCVVLRGVVFFRNFSTVSRSAPINPCKSFTSTQIEESTHAGALLSCWIGNDADKSLNFFYTSLLKYIHYLYHSTACFWKTNISGTMNNEFNDFFWTHPHIERCIKMKTHLLKSAL